MRQRKQRDAKVAHKSDRWTEADDIRLQELRTLGFTIGEIADEIKRTPNGVAERLKYLRRKARQTRDDSGEGCGGDAVLDRTLP